jgi:hypothetical protein
MNRITNEQREAIVRKAIAERDAILTGAPRKPWLWRNHVDGRPEYWAFDNPFPINLTDDDPQTLGEPCDDPDTNALFAEALDKGKAHSTRQRKG